MSQRVHRGLAFGLVVLAATAGSCKRAGVDSSIASDTSRPASPSADSVNDPRLNDPVYKFAMAQALLAFPPPDQTCPTDFNDADVTAACKHEGSDCNERQLLSSCTQLAGDGPRMPGDTAIALTEDRYGEIDMARLVYANVLAKLLPDITSEQQSANLMLNGAGTDPMDIIAAGLFGPFGNILKAKIPDEVKGEIIALIRASTMGAGVGFGGGLSAVVGKALNFEVVTAKAAPDSPFKGQDTFGLYCNNAVTVSAELAASITAYGIKAFGCEDHGDVGGLGIGVSLSAGAPLGIGSVGGSIGIGLSVDPVKFIDAFKEKHRDLLGFANGSDVPSLVSFFNDYMKKKVTDAQATAEVKAIRTMATVALGGMMHDFLRTEKKKHQGLEDFQKATTELAKGFFRGLRAINEKNVIKEGMQDLLNDMKTWNEANANKLAAPAALLEIIIRTIGCPSVTAGIQGSIGLGGKEEAGVGVGAGVSNAVLLGELRMATIKKLVDDIRAGQANLARLQADIRRLRDEANRAVSVENEARAAYNTLTNCINQAGEAAVRAARYAPGPDSFYRAGGQTAALPGCLVLAGISGGVQSVSGSYDRLQAAVSTAGAARDVLLTAEGSAAQLVEATGTFARSITTEIVALVRNVPTKAGLCALNTVTVPFASIILEETLLKKKD